MLLIRQIEAEDGNALAYECLESGRTVGRLTARRRADGGLDVSPIESTRRDVPRTLLTKLEGAAAALGITAIYLTCQDASAAALFESAGYSAITPDGLELYKQIVVS